ncbi:MAG: nucleotidyltransferase [Myxococcota bacterium]
MDSKVTIDRRILNEFCKKHFIKKLALFGSILRDDFNAESDVDVLVEFEEGHTPSFFKLFEIESELSVLFGGRKIDIVTYKALNKHLRSRVLKTAEVQYAKG